MTKAQKREILFGKVAEGEQVVPMMGHWNNDSACPVGVIVNDREKRTKDV